MLPGGYDRKQARQLLGSDSPVCIVTQNNDAHIVIHTKKNTVYATLFNPRKEYAELLVKRVNIPLAYILEQEDKDRFRLSLCEPDMRRASCEHMGLLTDEDVIQIEKPFNTTLTLTGEYEASCPQQGLVVTVDKTKGETNVTLATIRGENYTIALRAL